MRTPLLLGALVLTTGLWGATAATAQVPAASVADQIRGSISALNLKAQPATVKLTDEQGKSVTLRVDPQATQVLQDGRAAKLDALKPGQRVEVESTMKNGQQIAQKIEVISSESGAPSQGRSITPGTPGSSAPGSSSPKPGAPSEPGSQQP